MQRRRTFLHALAAGSAGLLAGCTDEAAPATTGTATDEGTTVVTPTATLTPTPTGTTERTTTSPSTPTDTTGTTVTGTTTATPTGTTTATGQLTKLAPDDGDGSDSFGRAVALAGGTAVVGAIFDEDPNGSEAGSAYVFERSDGTWSQTTKLTPDDGDSFDRFGTSVAAGSDTVVVGAPSDEDPNGSGAGSAYVFERSDGTWSQTTKLTPDDGDGGDEFGLSVTLGADTAVVGAPGDEDPNGSGAGAAYVFERSDGTWSQTAKLTADDGDDTDQFGWSVAVQDDRAVVGAVLDESPNGANAGSAYVFEQSSGSWSQQAKIAPDDGDAADGFGTAVALGTDTAIVGASSDEDPNGSGAGSAYVFERSDGTWSQAAKLTADDGDDRDLFGASLVLDDETALVAAETDEDPNGDSAGSAYVFAL